MYAASHPSGSHSPNAHHLAALTTHMIIAQLNEDHERQGNRHGIALVDAFEAAFRLDSAR